MYIELLVDFPYLGGAGTIVEKPDEEARLMIGNKLARACDGTRVEVSNKKMTDGKIRKGKLVNKVS
jgi:hypothetical protein